LKSCFGVQIVKLKQVVGELQEQVARLSNPSLGVFQNPPTKTWEEWLHEITPVLSFDHVFVEHFLNDPHFNFFKCLAEQHPPFPPVRWNKKQYFHFISLKNTWHPLTDADYMDWACVVQKRLLGAHTQWKTLNQTKVETQDKWGEQCNRALLKLLVSFQSPWVVKKVKTSFKKMLSQKIT
jgi:hypothetical protein